MSEIIGRVPMERQGELLEVYSDGKAYVYGGLHNGSFVYYRWPDGTWKSTIVEGGGYVCSWSRELEDVYSAWVGTLVMEPRLPR